jgi:hypothetical protein
VIEAYRTLRNLADKMTGQNWGVGPRLRQGDTARHLVNPTPERALVAIRAAVAKARESGNRMFETVFAREARRPRSPTATH